MRVLRAHHLLVMGQVVWINVLFWLMGLIGGVHCMPDLPEAWSVQCSTMNRKKVCILFSLSSCEGIFFCHSVLHHLGSWLFLDFDVCFQLAWWMSLVVLYVWCPLKYLPTVKLHFAMSGVMPNSRSVPYHTVSRWSFLLFRVFCFLNCCLVVWVYWLSYLFWCFLCFDWRVQ